MNIVETAVRAHIKGQTASDARKTVEQDIEALDAWIKGKQSPRSASYVQGVLYGILAFGDFSKLTH